MRFSAWPSRRVRQSAARLATEGRLRRVLQRVSELEAEALDLRGQVAALQAEESRRLADIAQQAADDEQVVRRLALAAPLVEDGVLTSRGEGQQLAPSGLTVVRRNAAMHNFEVKAEQIDGMDSRALNALQRRGARPRRGGRRATSRRQEREEFRCLRWAAGPKGWWCQLLSSHHPKHQQEKKWSRMRDDGGRPGVASAGFRLAAGR